MTPEQALEQAVVVHDALSVQQAIDRLAVRLDLIVRHQDPILVSVLQGGLYLAGQLLPRLRFPLQQATVQVTRYGDSTSGGELRWLAPLSMAVGGRSVVLVDDVFDGGLTLALLREHLLAAGVRHLTCAVLARKAATHLTPWRPDLIALECGPQFLFGCGMDYRGYWRNLPAIYALPDHVLEAL